MAIMTANQESSLHFKVIKQFFKMRSVDEFPERKSNKARIFDHDYQCSDKNPTYKEPLLKF